MAEHRNACYNKFYNLVTGFHKTCLNRFLLTIRKASAILLIVLNLDGFS